MGPGAFKQRGARHLRYRRRISDRDQQIFMIDKRVAFALRPCGWAWIFRRRNKASSCCSPNLRRDLAVEQGHWLSRWRHAPLQEWARRTYVRIRCLQFDHMIGRQFPQGREPKAPLPRQVQQTKCCGRYFQLSSYAMRNRTGFRRLSPIDGRWFRRCPQQYR